MTTQQVLGGGLAAAILAGLGGLGLYESVREWLRPAADTRWWNVLGKFLLFAVLAGAGLLIAAMLYWDVPV